ncbi:hypothetical protein RRG08_049561 [Elysia crispata]|uniref:Uncharacterized protein n=1 Tax=Elysia crispata TaxID=231223 RepID=A0AAE0Z4C5_9GAST|nr:hypothetical protein RRG08_062946 [Elysia crispata]KAK3745134.1 hypothetical protein RRG08_062961 [Elysia crispata]KAK3745149.1 hypothetical protein RRG08_062976 [Elysia crispata]KAK3745164.1 hypothetical protein RRG08_062991 [Elysia crispata]KAK3762683.1 hypothetical protein RRG08_049547 [Elysia crispata]
MLDSLVRVSRRVGWNADRLATDPDARPASPIQSRESGRRARENPGPRQSNSPGGPGGLEARGRPSAPGRLTEAAYNGARTSRALTLPSPASSRPRSRSWRSARGKCTRRGPARRPVRVQRIPGRDSPRPHAALNSAGRLCGSTRLPLGGFTYS